MGGIDSIKLPARRSMRTARTLSLFQREVTVRLGEPACELLFEHVQVLTEGQNEGIEVLGTVMLSFDLSAVSEQLRTNVSPDSIERVLALFQKSSTVQSRIATIVRNQAESLAQEPLIRLRTDAHYHSDETSFHIDINFDAQLASRKKSAS